MKNEEILRDITYHELIEIVGHRNWKGAALGDTLIIVFLPGAYKDDDDVRIKKAIEVRLENTSVKTSIEKEHGLVKLEVRVEDKVGES